MNKKIGKLILIILIVFLCAPIILDIISKIYINKFYKASLNVLYQANIEYIKNNEVDLEINLENNNQYTNYLINDGYIKIKKDKISFTLKNYYLQKCAYKLEDSEDVNVIPLTDNCDINLINNDINNYFTFDSKTQTITNYSGGDKVIIPNQINGIDVINIGKKAFKNKNITSVYINENIKLIEEEAFMNNNITSLTILGDVVIEKKAFMNNYIENIDIKNATYGIDSFKNNLLDENNAYITNDNILVSYAGNSDTIVIPDGINKINITFNSNIKTFDTGNTLLEIPDNLFKNNNLEEVIIRENVKKIGKSAFENNNISKLTILSSEIIEENAFKNNKITNLTLPTNLKEIKNSSFMNNKIYDINFQSKLDYIGIKAFKNNYITSLNIDSKKIDNEAFMDNLIETININCQDYGIDSFKNNLLDENNAYIINDNILVSYGGYKKENIKILDNVIRISASFNNLEGSIDFNNTKIIDDNTFANNNLSKINLRNVIEIGENAFINNNINDIIIPSSVEIIKEKAFKGNNFNKIIIKNKTSLKDFKEIYFSSFDSGKIIFEGD